MLDRRFASSTATAMWARDRDLVERGDAAVEDRRGAGREDVVLALVQVGCEDRRQQQQPEDDAGVARGDRPAAVHRLRRAPGERALGQRGEREPETRPDCELRRERPGGSGVGEASRVPPGPLRSRITPDVARTQSGSIVLP